MIKKLISIILVISLTLCGCSPRIENNTEINDDIILKEYTGLDDVELQQEIIDVIYSNMGANFESDDYIIEDITSVYISKEYIEELEYNSKSNVYFGFTLDELFEQFQGKKYVFKLGDNNETVVSEFEEYNDVYGKMLKNVAIGSGVILICTTVSLISGGTISIIFATSAKAATQVALSSSAISGFISTAVKYYETGNMSDSIETGLLEASESYKWGAIIGSVTGGFAESIFQKKLANHTKNTDPIKLGRESEARATLKYGGNNQVSYLNGKEVATSELGATRPDIVRTVNGKLEAIEVKNYNLINSESRNSLYTELKRQVTDRVNHLPKGTTQRIVLDGTGRNYSDTLIDEVIYKIQSVCQDVYPNIPVDVLTESLI